MKTNMIKDITEKISKMSKSERIIRLIEIAAKEHSAMPHEIIELEMIQAIRESNGEIEEVKRTNAYMEKFEQSQNL